MPEIKLLGNKNGEDTVIYTGSPSPYSGFSRVKSISIILTVSGSVRVTYPDGPEPTTIFRGGVSHTFYPTCGPECETNHIGGSFTTKSTAYGDFGAFNPETNEYEADWRSASRTRVENFKVPFYVYGGTFGVSAYTWQDISDTDWQPSQNLATGRIRFSRDPNFNGISDYENCIYTNPQGSNTINLAYTEPWAGGDIEYQGTSTLSWNVTIA